MRPSLVPSSSSVSLTLTAATATSTKGSTIPSSSKLKVVRRSSSTACADDAGQRECGSQFRLPSTSAFPLCTSSSPSARASSARSLGLQVCLFSARCSADPTHRILPHRQHRRQYHDYIRTVTPSGSSGRISLTPSKNGAYGLAISRGTRAYQEDTSSSSCVFLPPSVLKASYLASSSEPLRKVAAGWPPSPSDTSSSSSSSSSAASSPPPPPLSPSSASSSSSSFKDEIVGQVAWFGCFDGHGGQLVSQFLSKELHKIFEEVSEDMVTDTVQYTRSLGGYFRRFNGGLLERWVRKEELKPVRAGASRTASARKVESTGNEPRGKQPQQDEQSQPKTFADLVNSAKAESAPDAGPGSVGSGTGTVSALEAANTSDSGNAQPSLIHSAEQRGETPSAGPVESARQADVSESSSSNPSSTSRAELSSTSSSSSDGSPNGIARRVPPPDSLAKSTMTLSERLTLAWLHADRLIHSDPSLDVGGSTASVLLLHSLDSPPLPFYSSSSLFLTTAHIGDTRMLLANVSSGLAIPLTNYHHPDDRSESERLRRMGAGMITDSFGEARWMGALANTRSFGDSNFKKVGVTSEPEVISQLVRGDDYAFVVAFSDGVGGVMSDQEIVDLCRDQKHPQDAARAVLRFAEELGAQDNMTAMVVPLKGWGKMKGEDQTKQRREFRRSKVDLYRDSRT